MEQPSSKEALAHWLRSRLAHWQQVEQRLKKGALSKNSEIDDVRDVLSRYRSTVSDLSLARRNLPNHPLTRYLESLFLRSQAVIYKSPAHMLLQLRDLYNLDVPVLMREMKKPLFSTLGVFIMAIFMGYLLVASHPDLASLFASPAMIEHVKKGELWTDGLLNITPSSVVSLQIITNNITVSLFAFALGALYGLGTLYIISLNGLMLGGIFAFTAQYGLAQRLFTFIIGHGVVELSVIIIAGAMGLRLGEALIRPGHRNRLQAFQIVTLNAGKVLLAAIPFLVLAGLIEGFISPDERFSLLTRSVVGVLTGAFFWFVMLFGLPRKQIW